MNLRIEKYSQKDFDIWDFFCNTSQNGTFLHTRKFIEYQSEKFIDFSLIFLKDEKLIGLFPLAFFENNESLIISHPGLSYGGIVHNGDLNGEKMLNAIDLSLEYLKKHNFKKLIYKPIPYIYQIIPSDDDIYALTQRGGIIQRSELSSSVNLYSKFKVDSKKVRLSSPLINESDIKEGADHLSEYWQLLSTVLMKYHNSIPTHNFLEIQYLMKIFPNNIKLYSISVNNEIIAGVILFITSRCWHVQYMASNEMGRKLSALDIILSHLIENAKKSSINFFDFGHSNELKGKVLNQGLYNFKNKFGGGGVSLVQFECNL